MGATYLSKPVLFGLPVTTSPDQALITVARAADDTTLGLLHSRFHELWSLRMGTSLEDRPCYTPTTCFETFPFPAGLTPPTRPTSVPKRCKAAQPFLPIFQSQITL